MSHVLDCPVSGCTKRRSSLRYAMCEDCWHLVPVPLRDRIRGYWGAIKSARLIGTREEQRRAARGLVVAKLAAVEAVERRRAEWETAA